MRDSNRSSPADDTPSHADSRNDLIDAALALAAQGIYVFRLHPRSKEPIGRWKDDSTRDPDKIRQMWGWTPDAGVAVDCEKSGILGLDVDPRNGGTVESLLAAGIDIATRQADTGGGGVHVLYRQNGEAFGDSKGALPSVCPGVDVKGRGYLVLPPSVHESGTAYRWRNDWAIIDVPEALAALLRPTTRPARSSGPVHDSQAYARGALVRATTAIATADEGERNDTLNREAFALARPEILDVLGEEEVRESLRLAAGQAGLTPGEIRATIDSAFGAREDEPEPEPPPPSTLSATVDVFKKWLSLDDTAPLYAVAAAVAANYSPGDPVWLLLVGPPSNGKTEILQGVVGLPEVHPVATLTEAALLSGTPKRDTTTGATGGLLHSVGAFGIILCKDFTSILAQNKDAQSAVLAALREIYDGSWDRAVGADGGRVLSWRGKCGLIGGVTNSYDRHHAVISSLGDRFVVVRLPEAGDDCALAVTHIGQEATMRKELADALSGVVAGRDESKMTRALTEDEQGRLTKLVGYTRRARCAVERDHQHEVLVLPVPEGPFRLFLMLRRLFGGLEAIGCSTDEAWRVVTRVAMDCVPAVRTRLLRALVAEDRPRRTAILAAGLNLATKTASRHLDDLVMLGLATRSKKDDDEEDDAGAGNSPDLWQASVGLRGLWPEK